MSIHSVRECDRWRLTLAWSRIRIPNTLAAANVFAALVSMLSTESSNPLSNSMQKKCQHPRVQIVARDEESEYVECLECREVFEASEFKDMAIEESSPEEI